MILINSSPKDALKIFQPFLPIFIPVGVGQLMAELVRAGIDARHLDQQVEEDVYGRVREMVKDLPKPYIFGFSVLTASYKNALEVSHNLKRMYPDSVMVFGGVHPTAVPEEVMGFSHVDLVLRGEGDQLLPQLYRLLKEGRDYSQLPNLSFRQNGGVVHNPTAPFIHDLDELAPFPYHLFEGRRDRYDLGFIVSSRGCPHRCIFCSNRITTGKRYRFRSNEYIISEMERLRQDYGVRHILFLDDNLLVDKKRIYDLMALVRAKGLHQDMTFSFQARGDNVDRPLLRELYASGFKSVFFGLETASEEIMQIIKKGETVTDCLAAAKMAKEIGFHVSATFIFALPSENHRIRMDAARLAQELDLDMVRFNNATPYPGTELYDIARRQGRLHVEGLYENFNSVSTFIESPFKKIPFSYLPEGSQEAEIRNDILISYLAFYLNPQRLKSILANPDLGVGWFDASQLSKIPALFILTMYLGIKFGELFWRMLHRRHNQLSFRQLWDLIRARKRENRPRLAGG